MRRRSASRRRSPVQLGRNSRNSSQPPSVDSSACQWDASGVPDEQALALVTKVAAFLSERPVPDRLAELGLPVLVIFGSQDRRWQPSSFEDYRRVPRARIEILNGVGHTPMLDDPDTTAGLLRGFALDITSH
ncbi:MAG: alpha/beta fold hydrolase [Actinophytocola sp.]|nr:alpha/beta fold hydrolase [Actinophytocola sp.]